VFLVGCVKHAFDIKVNLIGPKFLERISNKKNAKTQNREKRENSTKRILKSYKCNVCGLIYVKIPSFAASDIFCSNSQ